MNVSPTIGSLFTGYGGLDMAVELVTGGCTAWRCDNAAGASSIIDAHWPDGVNHGDVTKIEWGGLPPVDIITGGFPCQDVSVAGQRKGLMRYDHRARDNRTGLWAEMARAVDVLRPQLVVAENVRGILSGKADSDPDLFDCRECLAHNADHPVRAFGAVLADLASLGYDAAWHGLRASDVGAPHQRFRVFIIAWPADADREGLAQWCRVSDDTAAEFPPVVRGGQDVVTLPTPRVSDSTGAGVHGRGGIDLRTAVRALLPTPDASAGMRGTRDPLRAAAGRVGRRRDHRSDRQVTLNDAVADWGIYESAIRRWEILTRAAPLPTEIGPRGGRRLSAHFVEWMMGLDDGHVTSPGYGLSRTQQLTLLGNGVVTRQAVAGLRQLISAVSGCAS